MKSSIEETLTFAVALQQAGRVGDAQQIYEQIVATAPTNFDARHLLGVAQWQLGNLSEAIQNFRLAIALNPDFADAYYNLANAERDNGNVTEAIQNYRRALSLRADFPAAYTNLGHVLMAQGKSAEAADCCRRVIELQPQSARAYHQLARALRAQGLLAEAADYCRHALKHDPTLAEALNDLAVFHLDHGDFQQAIELCRGAIQRNPAYAEAHYNLGAAQFQAGLEASAAESYQRAIQLQPDFAQAHNNLGNVWLAMGDIDRAEASYGAALQLAPDYADARANESLLLLLRGDLERGWQEYEWRWKTNTLVQRQFAQPNWDGSPLGNRTILLHAEQGLGDTFQFIRYAKLVKNRYPESTVIVECQRPLARLLLSCSGMDRLVAEGDDLPHFDVHSPLLSLPARFQTALETIPADVPYLYADQSLAEHWRRKLSGISSFRVGINWEGRAGQGKHRQRNIPLKEFATLAQLRGVRLISLQAGAARDELAQVPQSTPIFDPGPDFDTLHGPFMDTAAIMMNLDLVITSDTSVPHLAGALGVPVWVALPVVPDWRWLLQRSDSPWYPTMRLFRQKKPGDWTEVFDEIREALQKLIATKSRQ